MCMRIRWIWVSIIFMYTPNFSFNSVVFFKYISAISKLPLSHSNAGINIFFRVSKYPKLIHSLIPH